MAENITNALAVLDSDHSAVGSSDAALKDAAAKFVAAHATSQTNRQHRRASLDKVKGLLDQTYDDPAPIVPVVPAPLMQAVPVSPAK